MHERAERLAGNLVTADLELEREFEARLADSSRLAFRVAFSVLRQREDAGPDHRRADRQFLGRAGYRTTRKS